MPQTPSPDSSLREHLVSLLRAKNAHVMFDDVIEDFPPGVRGVKPQDLPYTAWQIVEHLRIAQWDILEFSRDADHVSPEFPSGYWPDTDLPPDDGAWDRSVAAFRQDLQEMEDLVRDPAVDLFAPIPHGDGPNGSSRGHACGRSQRLSRGAVGADPSAFEGVAERRAGGRLAQDSEQGRTRKGPRPHPQGRGSV